jgi:hypothetical protein
MHNQVRVATIGQRSGRSLHERMIGLRCPDRDNISSTDGGEGSTGLPGDGSAKTFDGLVHGRSSWGLKL